MFKSIIISFISKLALDLLHSLAKVAWEEFWDQIFESVRKAELQWKSSGSGELKKAWVVNTIYTFINEHKKLSWFQSWYMRKFIEYVVDQIIEELNKQFEHDWVSKISDIKIQLEKKIPFVK